MSYVMVFFVLTVVACPSHLTGIGFIVVVFPAGLWLYFFPPWDGAFLWRPFALIVSVADGVFGPGGFLLPFIDNWLVACGLDVLLSSSLRYWVLAGIPCRL